MNDVPEIAVQRLARARGITLAMAADVLRRNPEALAQIRAELAAQPELVVEHTIESEPFADGERIQDSGVGGQGDAPAVSAPGEPPPPRKKRAKAPPEPVAEEPPQEPVSPTPAS